MRLPFSKGFFFRSDCNSNKPNASSYPELKYRDCLLFGLISQIWQSCFLINHLLRNLTFNRSPHCTQVSDQCPLGLLFFRNYTKKCALLREWCGVYYIAKNRVNNTWNVRVITLFTRYILVSFGLFLQFTTRMLFSFANYSRYFVKKSSDCACTYVYHPR